MKLNHFICPTCGHDFYAEGASVLCDACQCCFYASQSKTVTRSPFIAYALPKDPIVSQHIAVIRRGPVTVPEIRRRKFPLSKGGTI